MTLATPHRCTLAAIVVSLATGAWAQQYRVTPLVSDLPDEAAHKDALLVNPWGIAFNPQGFVWVANNETGSATLYDGNGSPQSLIVGIPSVPNSTAAGHPTGIVFSGAQDLVVTQGGASGPARFVFATLEGTISGWAPTVDQTHAIITVDSTGSQAIYTGLAVAQVGGASRLYAADFHNARVDVFDGSFQIVRGAAFADAGLPARFAPFGIQVIGDRVYVTYAKQDLKGQEEITGPGLGAVNVFDLNGNRLARVATGGPLNAPWGVAQSPGNFGSHSNEILVGNLGDGRINTFRRVPNHPLHFQFKGPLKDRGHPIEVEGLWGIAFGNGLSNQPTNTLFFAAGIDDEEHGLYGRIDRR